MSQKIISARRNGFSQVILLGIAALAVIMSGGGYIIYRVRTSVAPQQHIVDVAGEKTIDARAVETSPPIREPLIREQSLPAVVPKPKQEPVQFSAPVWTPQPSQQGEERLHATQEPIGRYGKVAPSCVSNLNPIFTNHITDINQVRYIVPPPTMGAGPSLKPHSYIGTDHARVPIYAPTAVTLKSGSHYIYGPYMFELQASCEVTIRFGHITEPVAAIKDVLPKEPQADSRTQELPPLAFAAGELLGYTTGTDMAGNWDFGVYNAAIQNRYANDPDWNMSTTYTTAVCPFDYFTSGLKSVYVAKFNATALGGNPPHGPSFCGGQ